ncbi:hypothetical protein [Streptomyces sp. NA04227]|uniref:hypothetical protein n=1 Tax=Streptomyces sp. NA04227 TaxID=2742136 RepID=UPI0020CA3367|nr:hypothetical protein [Streptomyces sp. NA04227]
MTEQIKLATCTYQEFAPHMGTPVRTTVGHPRFPLSYQLGGIARSVTPTRSLLKIESEDAYEFIYRRLLNERGIDAIREELTAIAGANDLEVPVVLLCFDKLSKPGNWCHRTHFAKWWTEQTGQEVPELGAAAVQPPQAPPALFEF